MKQIGDAADDVDAKRFRHRKFHWCRLHNGFVDMPLWRAIAGALDLPLTQVQAFVVRLDSFANKSIPRGYVGDFDAAEFAAALDLPAENCARIFAALEEREWIEQDALTTFWPRNPDKDDPTATERQERARGFKATLRELTRLLRAGIIDDAERAQREIAIYALRDQGRHGLLSWADQRPRLLALLSTASTCHAIGHDGHDVTAVTVDSPPAVDNGIDAKAWLRTDARRLIADSLRCSVVMADTRLAVWRRKLAAAGGGATVLRALIEELARVHGGLRLAGEIDLAIARFAARASDQRQLPLPVPLKGVGNG